MGSASSGNYGRRSARKTTCEVWQRTTVRSLLRVVPPHLRKPEKVEALTGVRCSVAVLPTGAWRWWMHCPRCGHPRATLYRLPDAGLACRVCHRLNYRSQRLTTPARWRHRARKLFARARCSADDSYFYRPKGMHWATFNRLIDEAEGLELAALGLWVASFVRGYERSQANQ